MTDSRCFDADLLGIIKRNFRGLRQDTFIMLYKFLVRSHLEYATTFGSILFAWELQKCGTAYLPLSLLPLLSTHLTRKPSYRWQTRATQKACQKLLQFDVLTTLSLTILAYLHSFSCCCVRNLRNPAKFIENSNLWSSRSSKVIDLGVNRKPMYDFILVTNSNFSRICYLFRDIHA